MKRMKVPLHVFHANNKEIPDVYKRQEDYYKQSDLLGTKAYTAVDLSVSDSIRKLDTYVPSVSTVSYTHLDVYKRQLYV